MYEDINDKAYDDELNKAEEEIHQAPRNRIAVPKPEKNSESEKED